MNNVSLMLAILLLTSSCAQYSVRSVPVSQAINTGPVKIITKDGRKLFYSNLFPSENGQVEIAYNDSTMLTIDTISFTAVYPKLKGSKENKNRVPVKIWIKQINGDVIEGFLVYAEDSVIGLSTQVPNISSTIVNEIDVTEIEQIAYRKKSAPTTGFLVGLVAPLIFILPASGGDLSYYVYAVIFLHLPAAVIGALIGTIKKKIQIDGSMQQYKLNRHKLIKIQPK